jgi:hypothetical protein
MTITLTREEAQQVLDALEKHILEYETIQLLSAKLNPPQPEKCIVKDCENHKHQGRFVGDLCSPCHAFITRNEGKHSQAYRNAQPEPEPVAWEYCGALFHDKKEVFAWHERGDISNTPPRPLYDAPLHRKPWDNKVLITDEYERGVIDGMQKQMQSSVDKAVNKMAKREWQGLTDEEILGEYRQSYGDDGDLTDVYFARAIEAKLREKNV